MKILIINDVVQGGGVERVMQDIVSHLCQSAVQTTVLCLNSKRKEMRRVLPPQVTCMSLQPAVRRGFRFHIIRKLHDIWKKYVINKAARRKWDVVLAIKEGDSMKVAASIPAERKFAWVHVDYQFLYWTKAIFTSAEEERTLMQHFDAVVCVSQAAADSVRRVIGDPGNLCVRYNPLDASGIRKKALLDTVSKDSARPRFVAAGRLVEEKNFLMLVQSAIKLLQENDFELHIVGNGPQHEMLHSMIAKAGVQDNIKLLGFQENPYPYIKSADWFVSTSVSESYGLVVQEALILGVPVITTRCPAIDEVCDARCCILLDNEEKAFIEGMRRVLNNPTLKDEYRARIQAFYPDEEKLYNARIESITQLWNKSDEEKV